MSARMAMFERVQSMCRQERISPEHQGLVQWYLETLDTDTHFAGDIIYPGMVGTDPGCFVLSTTPESTRLYLENQDKQSRQERIVDNHWELFRVHWQPGVSLLNFHGMARAHDTGVSLGQWLNNELMTRLPAWKVVYALQHGSDAKDNLRRILHEVLGAPLWLEVTSGYSYRMYRAVDVYVRVHAPGMPMAVQEMAWQVCTSIDPMTRQFLTPEQYKWGSVWVQRHDVSVLDAWSVQVFPRSPVSDFRPGRM